MSLSLSDCPKFTISPTGLSISEDLSFEEWEGLATNLCEAARGVAFVIGDWLIYGERRFATAVPGKELCRVKSEDYERAIKATGLDRTTLHAYTYVARRVPASLRNQLLSWEHHKTVAKLEPDDQSRWLQLAAERLEDGQPVSTRRLRKSIQAGRLLATDEIEVEASDRGIENHIPFVNRLSAWWSRLKERRWLDSASREQRAALKRDLHPLVEIYQQL
jgi:hypothetical protein